MNDFESLTISKFLLTITQLKKPNNFLLNFIDRILPPLFLHPKMSSLVPPTCIGRPCEALEPEKRPLATHPHLLLCESCFESHQKELVKLRVRKHRAKAKAAAAKAAAEEAKEAEAKAAEGAPPVVMQEQQLTTIGASVDRARMETSRLVHQAHTTASSTTSCDVTFERKTEVYPDGRTSILEVNCRPSQPVTHTF